MSAMMGAAARKSVRRAHLLVVDDDNLQRMIVRKIADAEGYELSEAATYEEAVTLLEKRSFDCLLLDLSLGRRSGVELLRLLKQLRSQMPIIVISGSHREITNMAVGTGKLAKLNMLEPIPKPIRPDVLAKALSDVCRPGPA